MGECYVQGLFVPTFTKIHLDVEPALFNGSTENGKEGSREILGYTYSELARP
jgi:hypothetical protein